MLLTALYLNNMDNDGHGQIMLMLGRLESKVDSIHEQVKKTNGRVTELENVTRNHDNYILSVNSKVGVITALVSLLGVAGWNIAEHIFFK